MDGNNGSAAFVSTGVSGLDHVLMGGFLREGFYLIQGDPGSGKTTVALQFILCRLREGERCLYITLTETRQDLEVVAQHGMIVGVGMVGDVDVSYLADTVLLFRYFEARGEILQAVGVFKKRTGEHERSLRQLQISARGVAVGAPLREFRGIMTGVPQFEAGTDLLPEPDPHTGRQGGATRSDRDHVRAR